MLVSAVITTHKREPELVERALQSVLNQTYKDIELFVVDDSPSEYEFRLDVKAMVESYSDRNVTYIAHEKCMGACVARNTGLAAANGEFIGFLDDDDEWLPEKIEEQVKKFTSEDIALVYCGSLTVYEKSGIKVDRTLECITENVYEELLLRNFIGSTSFPLLRVSALRKIGGFDPEMQSAQDFDVWLRIAKEFKVDYVNKPLVVYHYHDGEQITKNPAKKIAGLERIIQKNYESLVKNKSAFSRYCVALAQYYARNKQKGKAFATWIKAVFKRPFNIKENIRCVYGIFRIMILKDKA